MKLRNLGNGRAFVHMDGMARVIDVSGIELPDNADILADDLPQDVTAALIERFEEAKPKPGKPDKTLKQVRRDKMIRIGNSSVQGRARVFKAFPHVHVSDQHRHIDVMVMYMRGKLTETDTFLTRHLKTGEFERITVGAILDEIESTFWLRQKLRERDQLFRDQVNAIRDDTTMTEKEKVLAIEALEVPENMGVAEDSSATDLKLKG